MQGPSSRPPFAGLTSWFSPAQSGEHSKDTDLKVAKPLDLPPDVWNYTISSFFSTQEELAILRLVSRDFKIWADEKARTTAWPALDYSLPLPKKVKSFSISIDGSTPSHVTTVSNHTRVGAVGDTLYHYDLSHYETNFFRNFPTQLALCKHTSPITTICVFDENRIISGSKNGTLFIHDTKTRSTLELTGHTKSVTGVVKLSENRIASASLDKTVRVWNINTGKCHKIWIESKDPINAIIKLPEDNSILAVTSTQIIRWNINNKTRGVRSFTMEIHSVSHSDNQLLINVKDFLLVTSIAGVFDENTGNSDVISIPRPRSKHFHSACFLPDRHIACLMTDIATQKPTLMIYSREQGNFVSEYTPSFLPNKIELLTNQRIALCGEKIEILPFALKENVQKSEAGEKCAIQ